MTSAIAHADRPDGPKAWSVAITAMLCLMVGPSALLVACFGVLVGPLSQEFGWSRGEIGAAVSFMAAAIMVVSVIQGALIDRFGVRRIVLASIPVFALALAGLRWLPASLPVFYALWFLLPFAAIGIWPASYLKAVSRRFERHLGLAIGVANAGIALSMMVMPGVITSLIGSFGLRDAFLGIAGLALLALPLAALNLRGGAAPVGARSSGAWTYLAMFRNPTYRRIFLSLVLLGFAGTGLLANLVPILTSKGLTAAAAVGGLAGYGATNLLGRLGTGALLDRFHVSKVYGVLTASTVLALAGMVVRGPEGVLVACAVLLGVLAGGEFDVLAYTIRRYFGLDAFGRMYGVAFSAFQLGASAGALLLAASVDWTGSYDGALLGIAVATSLSGWLLGTIGPYPKSAITPTNPSGAESALLGAASGAK